MTPADFKQARQSLGLSAQAMADILDVNIATVQKWEAPAGAKTARKPDAIAVRALQWMLDGFRPPQFPR
jgi:DNA-binding transcriptional regulator YiaG